jgi:TRAP transporter 4TM/12TM fusion protein
MIILTLSSIVYAFFGAYFPDLVAHKGAYWEDIINICYVLPEGLYGLPIAVMTSYVFLFIIFGALLEASGGITHIMNFANALVGRSIGGPAKIAVVSSGMMGSISGSAIANVVTTGTMTIPMMKRIGFSPHLAGGIEAIASTGGLIMPPIMGAAAFVMCEMIGTTYLKVIVMAAIPAVLYYFTLFIIVHLEAKRIYDDPDKFSKDQLTVFQAIIKGWWVAIPVLILVVSLVVQYSPSRSVVVSILSLICIIIVKNGIVEGIKLILNSFVSAARSTAPISILCAAAGIIIGMLFLTGLGLKFSGIVISLAHGVPIIALMLVMSVCIILGMGLPVTASYITTVTLSAPALVAFGFPLPAIHLFIIFFAVLSGITPPVCLASYTAAGVAKSDLLKTSWVALKYGFTGYIIPYLFIFMPSLLIVESNIWSILFNTIKVCFGLMAAAIGIVGFIDRSLAHLSRLIFVITGFLLVTPSLSANIIGFIGLSIIFLYHKKHLSLGSDRFANFMI